MKIAMGNKHNEKQAASAPTPTVEEMTATLHDQEARLTRIVEEAGAIEGERQQLEREWSNALAVGDENRAAAAEEGLQQLHVKRRRLDATIPGLRSAIEQLRHRIEFEKIERRQMICRQLSAESVARDRRRDELIAELAALSAMEFIAADDFERNRLVLQTFRADGPIGALTRPGVRRLQDGRVVNPAFWFVGRLRYSDGKPAWPNDALVAAYRKALVHHVEQT